MSHDPNSPSEPNTEAELEAARDLDRRTTAEVLQLIHAEDRRALAAVEPVLPAIERAVECLAQVLRDGGRWFNVGAGTSGRLGACDAAEIPPTFGMSPDRVQAILAGGPGALLAAVEGAEDDPDSAGQALRAKGAGPGDAVLAISASGHTPFALGALDAARELGMRRLALTCDPASPLAAAAEICIAPQVGPEVIAGSTRMKGGLIQKATLHLISTGVMVRLGRVEGNRMTCVQPNSAKLRRRAAKIVAQLGGVDEHRAAELLERSEGDVKQAVARARRLAAKIPPLDATAKTGAS